MGRYNASRCGSFEFIPIPHDFSGNMTYTQTKHILYVVYAEPFPELCHWWTMRACGQSKDIQHVDLPLAKMLKHAAYRSRETRSYSYGTIKQVSLFRVSVEQSLFFFSDITAIVNRA